MTRDEAIEILESVSFFAPSDIDVDTALDMAIEALERKRGEWLGKPFGGYSTVRCSVCRSAFLENSGMWNYCPNCGADMRGEHHD